MIRPDDLALFTRAAALSSFSDTAREVDLLPGQVSAAIKRLEGELGVRLFARSTRSLRLTAEGVQYLPYAHEALSALREGRERLQGMDTDLRGTLQLAAPSDLGRNMLLAWLSEFRRAHPRLRLRLQLSDQVTNIFRDPVDVAIRYGSMADASYVALPLAANNRRILVASPSYLQRCGHPDSLEALSEHECLVFMTGGSVYDKWKFVHNGESKVISVDAAMISDDADVVRRWAIDGLGIAYKSQLDVAEDLREGRLQVVPIAHVGEPLPLHLLFPHRKQFSPAIRQLHKVLADRFTALTTAPHGPASAH